VQAHDADLDSWAGVTRASGFDTFAATPSSANLAGLVSDETGTGALVFANSPTLVTPALGTPASGVVTNLTGTASININGTVGATTPSTGAFTTLGATGAVTFDGISFADGTAANTLVTTSGGNVGIGTSSPANKIDVSKSVSGNNNHGITITNTSTAGWGGSLQFAHTLGGSTAVATRSFISSEGGPTGSIFRIATCIGDNPAAERMRIDTSGNVGIGTTTPTEKLDVTGTVKATAFSGPINGTVGATTPAAISGTTGTFSDDINFSTFPRGLTYSAGTTNSDILRVGFISGVGDTLTVAPVGSGLTSVLIFKTAASSTITERMRITSAGNVGIGTTSPLAQLDVVDRTGNNNTAIVVSRSDTDAASKSTAINIRHWLNAEEPVCLIGAAIEDNTSNDIRIGGGFSNLNSATSIAFRTAANNATTNGTERMRIDSAGNVGIGTTTPGSKLDVDGELRIGNTVNTVTPTLPNRTITMVIGGTTYYIHAKTTND
jgi:hypothetical protein